MLRVTSLKVEPAKVLFLVVLTLPFWALGHALWEVDDARYAEIPREMVVLGDWATPHINFVDYVEKPPLPYWLGAASYSLFGVGEAQARIPLALLSVAVLLGTAWLGGLLFGRKVGVWAAVLLGTSAEFFLLSHLLTPDLPLTACLLGAQGTLLKGLLTPGRRRGWWVAAAGAFSGLAFLCKGLPGIVFPAGWTAACVLVPSIRRRLTRPPVWSLAASLAAFIIVAAPWFFVMEQNHPGFARFFIWEQHFLRYLTPMYQRQQPWYFFPFIEIVGFLPWTPLLLVAAYRAVRDWRREEAGTQTLWVWVGMILLFFSASSSKLATYILPIFPQQAILCAALLSGLESASGGRRPVRALGLALGVLLLVGGIVSLPLVLPKLPAWAVEGRVVGQALLLLLVLAGTLVAGTYALDKPRPSGSYLAVCGLGAVLSNILLLGSAVSLEEYLSAKGIAREIAGRIRPADELLSFNTYLHGLPYYTGRPVRVAHWRGELAYAEKTGKFPERFGDDRTLRGLPPKGRAAYVVLRKKDLDYFLGFVQEKRIKSVEPYGEWLLAVF